MTLNTLAAAVSSNTIPNLDEARITPAGVVVAFSLRRLFDAYTGALVRVRRGSDGAEQDFNADSNGELDTDALVNWVGAANSGYVVRWYDQSGGNHHADARKEYQPAIVSHGALVTENARPALRFAHQNTAGVPRATMKVASGAASRFNGRNIPLSAFFVARLHDLTDMLSTVVHMLGGTADDKFIAPYHLRTADGNSVRAWRSRDNDRALKRIIVNADYPTDLALMSYVFTGASGRIWQNGRAIHGWDDQALDAAVVYNRLTIGGRWHRVRNRLLYGPQWRGNISEVILYNQDRRFARPAIDANMMNYYKIRA